MKSKPQSLRGYLHNRSTKTATGAPGPSVQRLGQGPTIPYSGGHDPLEANLFEGDKEEYAYRHCGKTGNVYTTFDESRVDGVWDEDGDESWK